MLSRLLEVEEAYHNRFVQLRAEAGLSVVEGHAGVTLAARRIPDCTAQRHDAWRAWAESKSVLGAGSDSYQVAGYKRSERDKGHYSRECVVASWQVHIDGLQQFQLRICCPEALRVLIQHPDSIEQAPDKCSKHP